MIFEIALIIIISTIIASLLWKLKQPLILAYIIAGIAISPFISEYKLISIFADLGVAFLLFLVGIELSINKMRNVGFTSLLIGLGQIVFTGFIGYIISILLGFSIIEAIYISIALTFSSTIIIVKLLSEKNEIDTLYGRITIGFLLVQDFAAIITIIFLGYGAIEVNVFNLVLKSLISGIGLFAFSILSGRYLLPFFFKFIEKSQELLFLSSISWCLFFVFLSSAMNFSIHVGAFLAGLGIASSRFSYEISPKIRVLRDFFIILFFVFLGSQMKFYFKDLDKALILSLFVLIGNPLIVYLIMTLIGYKKRTSLFASLATAQISEFSLILVAMGLSLGHLSSDIVSLVTLVGIVTIAISSYMIIFNENLYKILQPFLFERKRTKKEERVSKIIENHVILIGYHRMGYHLAERLKNLKEKFIVIDFNPDAIKMLMEKKIDYIFGDATDSEILEEANIKKSKLIISTVPNFDDNKFIVSKAKALGIPVIVTSLHLNDALELYNLGASYVIIPHFLGSEKVASMLKTFLRSEKAIKNIKEKHMNYLEERARLGHY